MKVLILLLSLHATLLLMVVQGQQEEKNNGKTGSSNGSNSNIIVDDEFIVYQQYKNKNNNNGQYPSYISGRLGKISIHDDNDNDNNNVPITKEMKDDPKFESAAKDALKNILQIQYGYNDNDNKQDFILSTSPQWISSSASSSSSNNRNSIHVRYNIKIDQYIVEGAQLVMHVDATNGTVYAFNGEYIPNADTINIEPSISGTDAFHNLQSTSFYKDTFITITSTPTLTIVRNMWVGIACLAYKAHVSYITKNDGKNKHDIVFVEAHNRKTEGSTNNVCAIHPQIVGNSHSSNSRNNSNRPSILPNQKEYNDNNTIYYENIRKNRIRRRLERGIPNLETWDCNNREDCCAISCGTLISTSSNPINTGDDAIDSAHNYAIATYNFYYNNFNRDSFDDNGMTLISRVHYSILFANAFWDGTQMTYGDGDNIDFRSFALDADIVGHELTHGITERTSNLIYYSESGALNEGISDIMGAMVDRQEGATGDDIWELGEDTWIGDGIFQSMRDPSSSNYYPQPDYYPERYRDSEDYGGVHINVGIVNLAFYLLVTGGTHPHGKTNIDVSGIGFEDATQIFYDANVACFTPNSNFVDAVLCTNSTGLGQSYSDEVNSAWAAVGVPVNDIEPFYVVSGISIGVSGASRQFDIPTDVIRTGGYVQCNLVGNNGDADLRLGWDFQRPGSNVIFTCVSEYYESYEQCLVGPLPRGVSRVVAEVLAFERFTGVTLSCYVDEEDRVNIPPTMSPMPSESPSVEPTSMPVTARPTVAPSPRPTKAPTRSPTKAQTRSPTMPPSLNPTSAPTIMPSTNPSTAPSVEPSASPSKIPTPAPTTRPTKAPTLSPTEMPTPNPTQAPVQESIAFLSCSKQFNCGGSLLGGSDMHLDFLGLFCVDICAPVPQVFRLIGWNCGLCS